LGVMWWLWFRSEDVRRIREALMAAVIACFPALTFARVLSWIINRTRPLMETGYIFRVPYGGNRVWEGPRSFPSDHAVLFLALATGIFLASSRTGWFVFGYVLIFICMPRIYLAEHYAIDILAGGARSGSSWCRWRTFRLSGNQSRVGHFDGWIGVRDHSMPSLSS
jgi:undecaprenyl-diphosphatase